MLWKTPTALCPKISKYREIVGPGNSSADDSRVQKRRTIEYDFPFGITKEQKSVTSNASTFKGQKTGFDSFLNILLEKFNAENSLLGKGLARKGVTGSLKSTRPAVFVAAGAISIFLPILPFVPFPIV